MRGCTVTLVRHQDGRVFAEVRLYPEDDDPQLAVVDVTDDFNLLAPKIDPHAYYPSSGKN